MEKHSSQSCLKISFSINFQSVILKFNLERVLVPHMGFASEEALGSHINIYIMLWPETSVSIALTLSTSATLFVKKR